MTPPLCAACGMDLDAPGYLVLSETGSDYGHACDGSETMCARACPVEVPVPVERLKPCPNSAHGSVAPAELPF